jgi:hypothetical protein
VREAALAQSFRLVERDVSVLKELRAIGQRGVRHDDSDARPLLDVDNSSPPKRHNVSESRATSCNRRATAMRSWSPARWPSESFTPLKSSRSSSNTAQYPPSRIILERA